MDDVGVPKLTFFKAKNYETNFFIYKHYHRHSVGYTDPHDLVDNI